jgi:hypothetical protein
MDVMDSTSRKHNSPPAMKTSTVHHLFGSMLTVGRKRFIKQALMIALYLGLANELDKADLLIPALVLHVFFLLILPASFGMNAIYSNFLDIINPFKMLRFIYDLGSAYFGIVILFALGALLLWLTATLGISAILVLLPLALYVFILTFRMMGCIIRQDYQFFFSKPDFHAYKQEMQNISNDNREFDRVMGDAFQKIRDHQLEKAIEIVVLQAQQSDWDNFDKVYECCMGWPNKKPALALVTHYLPEILARQNPVRALDLCHWSLRQDPAFYSNDIDVLLQVGKEAFTRDQLRDSVKMLENYIDQSDNLDNQQLALTLARDIAESRLKDQALYDRLMQINV